MRYDLILFSHASLPFLSHLLFHLLIHSFIDSSLSLLSQVRFKCSIGVYFYEDELEVGDFVAVQCGKGYNVGAVSCAIPSDVEVPLKESTKHQKILNKLSEDKAAIEQMLRNKVLAENNALTLCRSFCRGHRIGSFVDAIAAEFQFDRKKLTVYVMKTGDASVCKLVRKLFDSFKMRISILDIESVEKARQLAMEYLHYTKLNLDIREVFLDPVTSTARHYSYPKVGPPRKTGQNSQFAHGGTDPALLSALQEYMPARAMSHSHPAPPHPDIQIYYPYSSQTHYIPPSQYGPPPPGPSRPHSDRYDQQYTSHRSHVDPSYLPQSMSYTPPYRAAGVSRDHDLSHSLTQRQMSDEYGSEEDQYFSAKGVAEEASYGDSLYHPYHTAPYPGHILSNEDLEQFDKSFDLSFRQLMIAPSLSDPRDSKPLHSSSVHHHQSASAQSMNSQHLRIFPPDDTTSLLSREDSQL
jgi:hypothetical protein